jgi:hypothetical protein
MVDCLASRWDVKGEVEAEKDFSKILLLRREVFTKAGCEFEFWRTSRFPEPLI